MEDKEDNRIPGLSNLEEDNWKDVRESVKILCGNFSGEYWRKLDNKREYPE